MPVIGIHKEENGLGLPVAAVHFNAKRETAARRTWFLVMAYVYWENIHVLAEIVETESTEYK